MPDGTSLSPEHRARWDSYFIPGTDVLRNRLGLDDAGTLQSAENDLVEARIAELRASPIIVRQTFDAKHLTALHRHLFQDVYEWAGELRTVGIEKGGEHFVPPHDIETPLEHLAHRIRESNHLRTKSDHEAADELAYLYDFVNYAHPFREGNGRTQREFLDQLMARSGRGLDWLALDDARLTDASHYARVADEDRLQPLVKLFADILDHSPSY